MPATTKKPATKKAPKPKAAPKATPAKAAAPKTRKPSMRSEAEDVLRAKGPMKTSDLIAEILKRGKLTIKGKTPEATLSALMYRSDQFKKTAPGTWGLA